MPKYLMENLKILLFLINILYGSCTPPLNFSDDNETEISLDKLMSSDLGFRNFKKYDDFQNHYKEMVSIRNYKTEHVFGDDHECIGVFITPLKVLTVANCLLTHGFPRIALGIRVRHMSVNRLNESQGYYLGVEDILIHPKFDYETLEHNLGILKILDKDVIDYNIDYDSVASLYDIDRRPDVGENVVLAGWGRIYVGGPIVAEAFQMDLKVYSQSDCADPHPHRFICAADPDDLDKSFCEGIMGAPLWYNHEVIGILTHGSCIPDYKPAKFIYLPAYVEFLDQNTANFERNPMDYCCMLLIVFGLVSM